MDTIRHFKILFSIYKQNRQWIKLRWILISKIAFHNPNALTTKVY